MKYKYKGVNPICQEIKNAHDDFTGNYHPACCRFPKSCSANEYEFFPEADFEQPKKLKVKRTVGYGPGTDFDWIVYGYHPTAKGTVTLLKYFATSQQAYTFINGLTDWQTLLKNEGFTDPKVKFLYSETSL